MESLGCITELHGPDDWGCRILRLRFCIRVRPLNEWPRYDTKQSDGESTVMLELWGMRSTLLLLALPGLLWPGVETPDRVYGSNKTV